MTAALASTTTVITVGIYKGGAGKTSLTSNLAGILARLGYSVLIVVTDPQDNEGEDLGYTAREESDDGASLAAALLGTETLRPLRGVRPNLDVVTAGEHLIPLCEPGAVVLPPTALADALVAIAEDYDFVLIDTPPSEFSPMQVQAFAASRWLLAPTQVDESSIKGIAGLGRNIAKAREVNEGLGLLGVVMFDTPTSATRIIRDTRQDIEARLAGIAPLFQTPIRSSKAVARDCRAHGMLAHELADYRSANFLSLIGKGKRQVADASGVAADYMALARELLDQLIAAETTQDQE